MAEMSKPTNQQSAAGGAPGPLPASNGKSKQNRGPTIHQIYALPAPIRTFPLPTFYPDNPLSLFHVAYEWFRQIIKPPPSEPAAIHNGVWSASTISVHITDEKSMRALWEQGFYGKGSLSRSEPNWLKREKVRRGLQNTHVSEILTIQRREQRIQAKWERARLEQEAIRQTRLLEAQRAQSLSVAKAVSKKLPPSEPKAPVGPLEILALPNSSVDPVAAQPVYDLSLRNALLPSGSITETTSQPTLSLVENHAGPLLVPDNPIVSQDQEDGIAQQDDTSNGTNHSASSADGSEAKVLKRQKSVRFSPKVESTTFELLDPPSPNHSPSNGHALGPSLVKGANTEKQAKPASPLPDATTNGNALLSTDDDIVNKEHLQLLPEEVMFLTFGLGALSVTDPVSGQPFTTENLLQLFREYSYFPPRNGPDDPDLQPDDEFLVNYAVYHYFRSLGWVPRAGIKFGVDWLLYARGPVFDHAEFGLIVIPTYTDPWWTQSGKKIPQRTWAWLHSVIRVLSHVIKSLVLVYVDIPPPPNFDKGMEKGFAEALKQYKVREIMVKRWSSKRHR